MLNRRHANPRKRTEGNRRGEAVARGNVMRLMKSSLITFDDEMDGSQ